MTMWINGQAHEPFDRIPVKSLKTYRHKGETVIPKGGPAELWATPQYGLTQKLYLMCMEKSVAVETDAQEGVHFEWL